MNLDWNSFTPESALAGGVILGLASALFILINGQVLGISGIIGGLFRPRAGDIAWRIAFLLGLLSSIIFGLWTTLPDARVDADWPTVGIAGLLVGIGTRYGAGCTSGHGVYGLSRLSPRSMIANLSFMAAGFLTVYALRHLAGAA